MSDLQQPAAASELLSQIWPWVWSSCALIAWSLGWWLGTRRAVNSIQRRIRASDLHVSLSERVVPRTGKMIVLGMLVVGVYSFLLLAPLPETVKDDVQVAAGPWVWATISLVAFITIGIWGIRRALVWLGQRVADTKNRMDDALVEALNRPLHLTIILLGVNLWADLVPLPDVVAGYVATATKTSIIVLFVLLADGAVQGWMIAKEEHSKVMRTSGIVLRSAVRIGFYAIGLMMALSSLGVDVTPIMASLGVTSIAIGLALQGTLEDFLAGLLLAADQPVSVGDFVELESGLTGTILSIGWRTTRIHSRDDMHVIVPNSKLSRQTLINRSRPKELCRFTVSCGVHYDSDLNQVSKVALEVAAHLQKDDGRAAKGFKPRVIFKAFNDSSVDFVVWLAARSWEQHFGLQDRFIRDLHRGFGRAGIVIPYPIRTLDLPSGVTIQVAEATPAPSGQAAPPELSDPQARRPSLPGPPPLAATAGARAAATAAPEPRASSDPTRKNIGS